MSRKYRIDTDKFQRLEEEFGNLFNDLTGDFDDTLTNIDSSDYLKQILDSEITLTPIKDRNTNEPLLYDHSRFNEAMEIFIKMVDRFDRFDRMFDAE